MPLKPRNANDTSDRIEIVVKLLLRRKGVHPDMPDTSGQTPLPYAAQHGFEEVVKIPPEREEVDPDKPDNCGRTPLSMPLGKEVRE